MLCAFAPQVDEDNSGEIEFGEFCKVIEKHKTVSSKNSDEADTIDAFVALGGNVSANTTPLSSMQSLQMHVFVVHIQHVGTGQCCIQAQESWLMTLVLLSSTQVMHLVKQPISLAFQCDLL